MKTLKSTVLSLSLLALSAPALGILVTNSGGMITSGVRSIANLIDNLCPTGTSRNPWGAICPTGTSRNPWGAVTSDKTAS